MVKQGKHSPHKSGDPSLGPRTHGRRELTSQNWPMTSARHDMHTCAHAYMHMHAHAHTEIL